MAVRSKDCEAGFGALCGTVYPPGMIARSPKITSFVQGLKSAARDRKLDLLYGWALQLARQQNWFAQCMFGVIGLHSACSEMNSRHGWAEGQFILDTMEGH